MDFTGFAQELVTRNHNADGLLFASLFLPESERHRLFKAHFKQSGYQEHGSPLYTALCIVMGQADDLLEESLFASILDDWQTHVGFTLKVMASA